MAESSSAPAPQSSNTSSTASSNYYPRKSRPHPHHHHHPPFQHFTHYHHCTYPAENVDGAGGTNNGATSPAKFYFGPGFEPQQQIPGGGYGPGPSQGRGNEYVVFFHVNPGVTISFQMGENLEILRGKRHCISNNILQRELNKIHELLTMSWFSMEFNEMFSLSSF
ncbi:hypothetical protein JTB14_017461 [Gonioctena quinquepunctata]|nr:hypothetical protein JTB14_017461 [Gonioctena quinquepunctata]